MVFNCKTFATRRRSPLLCWVLLLPSWGKAAVLQCRPAAMTTEAIWLTTVLLKSLRMACTVLIKLLEFNGFPVAS